MTPPTSWFPRSKPPGKAATTSRPPAGERSRGHDPSPGYRAGCGGDRDEERRIHGRRRPELRQHPERLRDRRRGGGVAARLRRRKRGDQRGTIDSVAIGGTHRGQPGPRRRDGGAQRAGGERPGRRGGPRRGAEPGRIAPLSLQRPRARARRGLRRRSVFAAPGRGLGSLAIAFVAAGAGQSLKLHLEAKRVGGTSVAFTCSALSAVVAALGLRLGLAASPRRRSWPR